MRHNDQLDVYTHLSNMLMERPMQTIYSYDPATCNQIHHIKSMNLNQSEEYLLERTALNPNTLFISKAEIDTHFYIWKGPVTLHNARQVKHWRPISYDHLPPQLKAYMLIAQG